jgi:hypothetical protein
MPAQRVAQYIEDIARNAGSLTALGNRDLASARYDPLERRKPYKGVTANLLAALYRLEQKALALRPRRPQKGRNRCFKVCHQGAANGDERVRSGKRQKVVAAGLGCMGRGLHSLSVTVPAHGHWPSGARSWGELESSRLQIPHALRPRLYSLRADSSPLLE